MACTVREPAFYAKLAEIRNSQAGFAHLLGIKVISISDGAAMAELNLDQRFLNPTGTTAHGGAVFALADVAGGSAAWSRGYQVATASSEIKFFRPTLDSKKLIAKAKALKMGKRMYIFNVEVRNEDGTLIAVQTSTFLPLTDRPILSGE